MLNKLKRKLVASQAEAPTGVESYLRDAKGWKANIQEMIDEKIMQHERRVNKIRGR
jgi:hypothetical protein